MLSAQPFVSSGPEGFHLRALPELQSTSRFIRLPLFGYSMT